MEQTFYHPVYGNVPVSRLCGWAGKPAEKGGRPDLVDVAFELWTASRPRFRIVGGGPTAGKRSMLWEVARNVIGGDPPNYAQEIGDCVSFGGKNAIEYVQLFPISSGARDKWTRVFPPYLYGCGRVFVGKGQMGNQDGSVGAWQAEAVQQYGTIAIDVKDCPPYSGEVARQWGYSGPPNEFVPVGKEHLVKTTAPVQTWDDVVAALVNGYPCTIASNVGFDMTPRSDGFNHYSTHWGHQMCIIGVDDDASEPHACILNSWGDVHGQIIDFKTGKPWPVGTLRVRRRDVESILAEQDSFAYSAFVGFPSQNLPDSAFDLW
jgi:hypothetical protein